MRTELTQLIESLRATPRVQDPVAFASFENILAKIVSLSDPDCIVPLLLCLDDNSPADDLNFSIIHSIEAFDDDAYIDSVLRALPMLSKRAPRWTMILHMRILNSDASRKAYMERFRHSDSAERAAAEDILAALGAWRPEFAGRVALILSMK